MNVKELIDLLSIQPPNIEVVIENSGLGWSEVCPITDVVKVSNLNGQEFIELYFDKGETF
jgi:hypothetical protein